VESYKAFHRALKDGLDRMAHHILRNRGKKRAEMPGNATDKSDRESRTMIRKNVEIEEILKSCTHDGIEHFCVVIDSWDFTK
jgi:hypothetical protein